MPLDPPAELQTLLRDGDFVLFLGAGVAAEAGLPDWGTSLNNIATSLERRRIALYPDLIRSEAANGRFLEAAELLYLSAISDAVRDEILQEVFGTEPSVSRRLKLLATTRCQGIVTTNFDRSIDRALTEAQRDVSRFTEAPEDLANARITKHSFFVRLHGRIEVPSSLVFSKTHYSGLTGKSPYVEYIRHLFLDRNLVFFGFSFKDPVITHLISEMSRAVNSVFRRKVFALFPGRPEPELFELFQRGNIAAVEYSSAEKHREAWELFVPYREGPTVASSEVFEVNRLRSHLATAYARAKARGFRADRHRVLAGLLVPVLAELPGNRPIELETFFQAAEAHVALPKLLGREPLKGALSVLENDGLVVVDDGQLLVGDIPLTRDLQADSLRLVEGVRSRAAVRLGVDLPHELNEGIKTAVIAALLQDGLHLSHSLVRGNPLQQSRLEEVIEEAAGRVSRREDYRNTSREAILSLFSNPDPEEERILANISAVAFATALLLADPILAASSESSFKQGAYVDASILLPWISDGHPLQRAYSGVLSAFEGRVRVLECYLNEIVTHRHLAFVAVRSGVLDDPERLRRYGAFFELHNINTFIAGFAARLAAGTSESFEGYMSRAAPFSDEEGAAKHFEKHGLAVEAVVTKRRSALYGEIQLGLREAANRSEIVARHDALQIDALAASAPQVRPYFVTADRALLKVLSRSTVPGLLKWMLLPHQVGALAELADRGRTGFESFARTMWNLSGNLAERVRRYYTDKVLREYEYALVSEIPTIVNEMLREFENEGVSIDADIPRMEGEEGRLRAFSTVDRFESRFYEHMNEARRRAGLPPA